jgi:Uma2 family endonuclease
MADQIQEPVEQAEAGIITPEALRRLDTDESWMEVDDARIIESERDMTWLHVLIIQNLYDLLRLYVRQHQLGWVLMDGARYILSVSRTKGIQRAYIPDLSFVRAGRIPPDFDWMGDFSGAPDLAVEVVSPGQSNAVVLPKISRYLESGTEEAWVIYQGSRSLWQVRRDAEESVRHTDQGLIETVLFPGLQISLAQLFETDLSSDGNNTN